MPIERQNQRGHRNQLSQLLRSRHAGFTLVELIVTMGVVGILALVAAPNMSTMMNASRVSAAASELTSSLQLARSEAIRRNTRVTVCASSNGTSCDNSAAWARWIVHGEDRTTGVDEVIKDHSQPGNIQVSGPAAGVVFRPSGLVDAPSTVTACVPAANPPDNQRVITVMISGSILSKRTNGGGTCP